MTAPDHEQAEIEGTVPAAWYWRTKTERDRLAAQLAEAQAAIRDRDVEITWRVEMLNKAEAQLAEREREIERLRVIAKPWLPVNRSQSGHGGRP